MSIESHATFIMKQLGCIEFKGEDSDRFLQGQITINTARIQTDQLTLGSICNPQGRCIAMFWATRLGSNIYFIQPKDSIPSTIEHLSKYAVFFKTEISNASDQFQLIGMRDAAVSEDALAQKLTPMAVSHSSLYLSILPIDRQANLAVDLDDSAERQWWSTLAENRIPWLTQESQMAFLPHNLDLPRLSAVDFDKGCFTGQEVIARMQYKGKLKSHLQLLKTASQQQISAKVKLFSDSDLAGEVVCSSPSQTTGSSVLALMKDKYLSTKYFRLNDENGPILELLSNEQE